MFFRTSVNPGSFGNVMIFGCGNGYALLIPDDNTLWSTTRMVVDNNSPAHWVAVSHDPNVVNAHQTSLQNSKGFHFSTNGRVGLLRIMGQSTRQSMGGNLAGSGFDGNVEEHEGHPVHNP